MTAHDTNLPTTAAPMGATPTGAVTPANRDTAPVIVWRTTADEPDAAPDTGFSDSPLTPRLAHHLVAIYSDVHGTVIDLDADDHLRHAAETTGRRYLALTSPTDLATLTEQPQPAALIVLRWPRPDTSTPEQEAKSLLSACRSHLSDDGCTIVAVTAAIPGQGTTYTEHEQVLLPAARVAGLRHLHDIVPLPATDGRDSFTYATAPADTVSDRDADPDTPRQNTSTTLAIFGHRRRRP